MFPRMAPVLRARNTKTQATILEGCPLMLYRCSFCLGCLYLAFFSLELPEPPGRNRAFLFGVGVFSIRGTPPCLGVAGHCLVKRRIPPLPTAPLPTPPPPPTRPAANTPPPPHGSVVKARPARSWPQRSPHPGDGWAHVAFLCHLLKPLENKSISRGKYNIILKQMEVIAARNEFEPQTEPSVAVLQEFWSGTGAP